MPGTRAAPTDPDSVFGLLGESRYAPLLSSPQAIRVQGSRTGLRATVRQECPRQPGNYVLIDSSGHVLYVGMSSQLRQRLVAYFADRVRGRKEPRLGRRTRWVLWQPVGHELVACLREAELISRLRPPANVQGHPGRMRPGYLTLSHEHAPRFRISNRSAASDLGVWGPLPLSRQTQTAIEALNLQFQLRDCPLKTPMRYRDETPQIDLPPFTPCLRADVGTCLAPCAEGCTRAAYLARVEEARAFLNGRTAASLNQLRSALNDASAARLFEKAARIRDRLEALTRLDRQLRAFHDWRSRANFVLRCPHSDGGGESWLVVSRGVVQAIGPRPGSPEDRETFRDLLQGASQMAGGRLDDGLTTPLDMEAAHVLRRWLRMNRQTRRRMTYDQALRRCAASQDSPR